MTAFNVSDQLDDAVPMKSNDDPDPAYIVKLRDGRRLAYGEYGSPHGKPVIYLPGTSSSRYEGDLWHTAAADNELRLISVERPGFGYSDPQPGRRVADWANDAADLTAALDMATVGIVGYSGGGPHALAAAAALPAKVSSVVVLNGVPPADDPELRRSMSRQWRILLALAHRAPKIFQNTYGRLVQQRSNPNRLSDPKRRAKPAHRANEAQHLRLAHPQALERAVRNAREGQRQGFRELCNEWEALWHRPWGFDPTEVRAPCLFLCGEQDASRVYAAHIAPTLASATISNFPGGHYSHTQPSVLDEAMRWIRDH